MHIYVNGIYIHMRSTTMLFGVGFQHAMHSKTSLLNKMAMEIYKNTFHNIYSIYIHTFHSIYIIAMHSRYGILVSYGILIWCISGVN